MTGAARIFVKELLELWGPPRPIIWIVVAALFFLAIVGNLRVDEPKNVVLFSSTFADEEAKGRARWILEEFTSIELIEIDIKYEDFREAIKNAHADIGVIWDGEWLVVERSTRSQRSEQVHALALAIASSLKLGSPWQLNALKDWAGSSSDVSLVVMRPQLRATDRTLVPAYIAFVVIFVPFVFVCGTIAKEQDLGTIQPLLVAPGINWFALAAGKIAVPVFLTFVIFHLLVLVSFTWFDLSLTGSWVIVVGIQFLAITASAVLGFVWATIVRSQQQANLAAAAYFLMLLLGTGFLQPIEQASPIVQYLSWVLPLTWSYDVLAQAMLSSFDGEAALPLAYWLVAQIGGFAIFAWVGIAALTRRL
jgi:hypothetical protein